MPRVHAGADQTGMLAYTFSVYPSLSGSIMRPAGS